jgi:hypothetical protein
MKAKLCLLAAMAASAAVGLLVGFELPSAVGQLTVVEIPNAVPQGVVVSQPNAVWRYQALDSSSRGMVIVDTQTGQAWQLAGKQWAALPALPTAKEARR